MEISPISTLSKEINKIREATASIVADRIIPNEPIIYKGGDNAKSLRDEIKSEVKKKKIMGTSSSRRIWWNGNRLYGSCLYE